MLSVLSDGWVGYRSENAGGDLSRAQCVTSWSLEWNFGSGLDDAFWRGYGEAPDPERIRRYRTLWGEAPTGY